MTFILIKKKGKLFDKETEKKGFSFSLSIFLHDITNNLSKKKKNNIAKELFLYLELYRHECSYNQKT